jgi:ethanolamine ammonia-lyase small subunit
VSDNLPSPIQLAVEVGDNVSEVTPARLFIGRTGTAYRTSTQLQLRADHAFAKDALGASLSLAEPPMNELVERFDLFEVATEANSHEEYLARPDKGRRLAVGVAETLRENCPSGVDVQFVIGDGLSPLAVRAQVPSLLGPLIDHASARGWSVGRPFFVRYCRVGVMNDIGEALDAQNVILLVGERPGLATAESLSAYMAHCPRNGDTDAQRNLVSNIHSSGVGTEDAVRRILGLVDSFQLQGRSGFMVKESAQPTALPGAGGR